MRLIDADALKESIPETEPDIFENCQICTTLMDYEVKDLINKQPTIPAPRWVRCEDVLPEIGQRVIVYDGWMQFMTRKDDQRFNGKMYWENEEGNWERVDDEAYWMPIEPPKEDA